MQDRSKCFVMIRREPGMIYHNLSVFCAVSDDEMISSLRLQLEIIHYDYTRTPMHRIYSKTAYQKLRTKKNSVNKRCHCHRTLPHGYLETAAHAHYTRACPKLIWRRAGAAKVIPVVHSSSPVQ